MQLPPFQPISAIDRTRYEKRFHLCSQKASDYTFVNIWGWRNIYGLSLAWEDDLVWIRQEKPVPAIWAPVGNWEKIDWIAKLSILNGWGLSMIRVPERLADIWSQVFGDRILIEESREHWDYLYNAQELRELKGNKYHKKKNLLSQFLRTYQYTYEPMGEKLVQEALSLQEDWCTWKSCEESESLSGENEVIVEVLQSWSALEGLAGGMIRVEGNPVAYTLSEAIDADIVVVHVEKGHPDYKGVYQAINWLFVSSLPESVQWINREQDLGDEGLRKAKLSYNPEGFVRKVTCIFSE